MEKKRISLEWSKVLLTITFLGAVVGILFATNILSTVEKNIEKAQEDARPANLNLTKITTPTCTSCFKLEQAVAMLKQQNVSIQEEKQLALDSPEAQSLIANLHIEKVPTYILTGEVNKKSFEAFTKTNGEIKNNTFVFLRVLPVFIDPKTKTERGNVTVTYITDTSCSHCTDPKLTITAYKRSGVSIAEEKELDWRTNEAQTLINTYHITKIPTFLLSQDIGLYETIKNRWAQIGSIAQDGTYIASNIPLPYRDLEKGSIAGLVDVIYLTDETCSDCYKPETSQRAILTQGYRMGIRSERTIDIASDEGQGFVKQYNITKVPTVLLSPEVDEYASLKNVWKNVGTVETDGWYIFREMKMLARITYKDLSSNTIVRPTPQPTVQQGG